MLRNTGQKLLVDAPSVVLRRPPSVACCHLTVRMQAYSKQNGNINAGGASDHQYLVKCSPVPAKSSQAKLRLTSKIIGSTQLTPKLNMAFLADVGAAGLGAAVTEPAMHSKLATWQVAFCMRRGVVGVVAVDATAPPC